MHSQQHNLYERIVLSRPVSVLIAISLITISIGWFAKDFSLDASADSLLLERDEDLKYYRYIRAAYGSDEYLIVTYTPTQPLFDVAVLNDLRALRDELAALPDIAKVTSILDVPLVNSPAADLTSPSSSIRYLDDMDMDSDRELARNELLESPFYKNLITNAAGTTTALRLDMRVDDDFLRMRSRRDELREKGYLQDLSPEEIDELSGLSKSVDISTHAQIGLQQKTISLVRGVLKAHSQSASLHLGGVPMIVADSIDFIRHDLLLFGAAVLIFLVLILAYAFRKLRWIFLPLLTCGATCVFMLGLLGALNWRVTIVSSNFVALLLILCLALTLHIIVRYRETHEMKPNATQFVLVSESIRKIAVPCTFTALTTIIAFGSLLVSGIRPVIDFGWMMSIGIVVAFAYSFTLFPAALMVLEPGEPRSRNDQIAKINAFIARVIQRRSRAALLTFLLLVLLGLAGAARLSVENRFIDYYRQSTEIYQGMELIDRELGGTTPLDVIIDAPTKDISTDFVLEESGEEFEDEFFDIYANETDTEAGITSWSYWFNSWRLPQVLAIHDYLDDLSETGKVVSIASFARTLELLDAEILNDNFTLSLIHKRLTPDINEELFSPYMSADGQQLRFSVRVFESDPTLRRATLLQGIRKDLTEKLDLEDEQIHLTGMLVLYNNLLQSLFQSQILTLGAVFIAITLMFLVLFRSVKTAVTAIIPNLVSAILVLGLMGWLAIPLDLMTITIAAITVGIAVDDTIHYVHRFRHEFAIDGDYWAAIRRCHRSIGRAIYYTSVTIMLGFSILAFSSFVPTIYFGVLTSVAMLAALAADMVLLPVLIVTFKIGGPDRQKV